MTKSKLDQALEDAEKAAENVEAAQAPAQTQAVATVDTGTAVAVGRPMGIMSLMNTGNMAADAYLKVDEYGLHIGTNKASFETIKVKLTSMKAAEVLRYGNPAIYEKTYDRLTSVKGEAWQNVCARVLKADPKANPYVTAEIIMVLEEDLKDGKGNLVAAKGTKVGYSTPPTGQKYVKELLEQLVKEGVVEGETLVGEPLITVGFVEVSKNGNTWGNVTFTAS